MGYYVSRQHYWTMDEDAPTLAVEIVTGGPDNASADELTVRYGYGEGETFDDPREAVKAALTIRRMWERDTDESIPITGLTTGYGMVAPDVLSEDYLREWAEKEYDSLPKCPKCGDLLGTERYGNELTIMDNEYPYCSEYCAEAEYAAELDHITTAVHCTSCDAMLPKDTRGWCDVCGADYEHLERVYE